MISLIINLLLEVAAALFNELYVPKYMIIWETERDGFVLHEADWVEFMEAHTFPWDPLGVTPKPRPRSKPQVSSGLAPSP